MITTRVLPATAPDALDAALKELRSGKLVVFPTDTVYGVGALVFDEAAVRSIYEAKGRSEEKAIPVLLGDPADLDKVAATLPPAVQILARRFWPGPLTLIVPKKPEIPFAVSATGTVGVRVPDHPVARALLNAAGPMAVTSANRSGAASPRSAEEALHQLDSRVALILDGGATPGGVPSTVLDCTQPEPRILREGPIKLTEIRALLE
ncbi:MAG TPA: L-threonylcarbamoyladenylate synthase [Anaerolineales bacterium]|nr:L-threonylcarbamoyladenylate synthase [Anaerolineales bacterium]